jgi:hypothetical protein
MGWPIRETELINRASVEDDPTQPEYRRSRRRDAVRQLELFE